MEIIVIFRCFQFFYNNYYSDSCCSDSQALGCFVFVFFFLSLFNFEKQLLQMTLIILFDYYLGHQCQRYYFSKRYVNRVFGLLSIDFWLIKKTFKWEQIICFYYKLLLFWVLINQIDYNYALAKFTTFPGYQSQLNTIIGLYMYYKSLKLNWMIKWRGPRRSQRKNLMSNTTRFIASISRH